MRQGSTGLVEPGEESALVLKDVGAFHRHFGEVEDLLRDNLVKEGAGCVPLDGALADG